VQTAVDAAFASLPGAVVEVLAWTGSAMRLSFGGCFAGVNVAPVVVTAQVPAISPELNLQRQGETVVIAAKPAQTVVVDYALGKTNLSVQTSANPLTAIRLNLDGVKGELLQASGNMTLDIYGFMATQGQLSLSKTTETLTLGDAQVAEDGTLTKAASQIAVDMLTIGGSNLSAFAGINGASMRTEASRTRPRG
jgi:hypothetical protein